MAVATKARRRKSAAAPKVQARRGRPPKVVSGEATGGSSLLTKVEVLVAANKDLDAQNARLAKDNEVLKALLAKIERALKDSPVAAASPTSASTAAPTRRARKPVGAKRTPRTSADPATQAKRRAALAKAREALAAKRAAAAA